VPSNRLDSDCSAQPAATDACSPCAFCDDAEANQGCSNHGTCENNGCVCNPSWTGATCAIAAGFCGTGVLDADGGCCASGRLSASLRCCINENAVLDKDGECCESGAKDSCGSCDGTGVGLDRFGDCCNAPGKLTMDMMCCASGTIDGCGMCDGDDSSCGVAFSTTVEADTAVVSAGAEQDAFLASFQGTVCTALEINGACNAIETKSVAISTAAGGTVTRRRLRQIAALEVAMEVKPLSPLQRNSVAVTGGNVDGLSVAAVTGRLTKALVASSSARRLAATSDVTVTDVGTVEKTFECGDGLCAIPERPVATESDPGTWCPADCPYASGSCPAPGSTEAGDPGMVMFLPTSDPLWRP
jgi:hypothetical protein